MRWSQVAQEVAGNVTPEVGFALLLAAFILIFGFRAAVTLAPLAVFGCSALVAWWLLGDWSWPLAATALLSIGVGGILGIALDRLAFGSLSRSFDGRAALIGAIAAGTALDGLAPDRVDPEGYANALPALALPWPYVDRLSASTQHGLALAALVLLFVVARWLFGRTHLGRAARAIAADRQAAYLLGIAVERTIAVTYLMAAAMGTAAGVLAVVSLHAEW